MYRLIVFKYLKMPNTYYYLKGDVLLNNKSSSKVLGKDLEHMMGFATSFARVAGNEIKKDMKLGIKARIKSDGSPITESDIKINMMLIEAIRKEFPTHDIMAEEGSYLKNKSEYRWICDPIDGTIVFSHGVPTCAFSISLAKNGSPILGVVHDPFMDRTYGAVLGNESYLNSEKISVSNDYELKGAVIGLSYWNGAQLSLSKLHGKLIEAGAAVLMLGSIVYMGAMVASGELAASIHPARFPYDSAALKVIISEAGGTVTNLYGNDQKYDRKIKGAVMSNGKLHKNIIDMIRKCN